MRSLPNDTDRHRIYLLSLEGLSFSCPGHPCEKIFFSSNRGDADSGDGLEELHLWMMNPDGTDQQQVSGCPLCPTPRLIYHPDEVPVRLIADLVPTWAADGSEIAFTRWTARDAPSGGLDPGSGRLWRIPLQGAAEGIPTPILPSRDIPAAGPSWNPAYPPGHPLADIVYHNHSNAIWRLTLSTGVEEQLIPPERDLLPEYSRDGTKLAWTRTAGQFNAYTAEFDSNRNAINIRRCTTAVDNTFEPSWSPSGAELAVYRLHAQGGVHQIWRIGCDDELGNQGAVLQLTFGDHRNLHPRWADVHFEVTVTIDIKPGSDPNSINLKDSDVVALAILSTPDFDASSVIPSSVEFGPDGATIAHRAGHLEDVRPKDGLLDLVLHFRTRDTGIACGDTSATLTGETFSDQAIEGEDSVRIVGCK